MGAEMERLYAERLARYTAAMRNEKPDRIPIRPFVAEFTAKYAGFTCQEVTHDYQKAFEAARQCAADFDWDAVVGNMVYVWTGLTQAIGLKYYAAPGIEIPADTGFQYLEPPEGREFMRADEYDRLIEDPTRFLFDVWLPRVSNDVAAMGEPTSFRNNMSFLKGGMAMWNYFMGFGTQGALLRSESGTVSAIAGILKAPFDILADKLRGYLGICEDLLFRPEKVLAACQALMPHLLHVALSGADPEKKVPISIWMHRGCVPFVSHEVFEKYFWATLKPIILEIWKTGHQVLFYAEGNWDEHLESFAELPDGSIVYHVDRGDIFKVHKAIGHKFCLSGGIPNYLLTFGTPEQVRDRCKEVIDGVAADGGYIMDASAIVQNDAKVENIRALTDFTREYGVYDGGSGGPADAGNETAVKEGQATENSGASMPGARESLTPPGVCVPWETRLKELPESFGTSGGDPDLVKRIWEENDFFGYLYIWHCLLSF